MSLEDTYLMFVGETVEVLTIASRREESAWQAPAVAQVITAEDISKQGAKTLSDVLETVPGFYMAEKEWGTQPYLRGIPDSVLFLYDTIPIYSDITKSMHPLDYELSLAGVKRIEIIRGPGSVLWGPDAFAGIVNIVPMSGKDIEGIETGASYFTSGNGKSFYINAGYNADLWDIFLSVSGRNVEEDDTPYHIVSFWGDGAAPTSLEKRYGEETPGNSSYVEASGRFSYEDWLTISGRISDAKRPYTMSYTDEKDLTWGECRDATFGMIKIEAGKELSYNSALRFAGSYTLLNPENQIIDRKFEHKEGTSYAELIYDRSFFGKNGLFTAGVSFREKRIQDGQIIGDFQAAHYLPSYLSAKNESKLPFITEKNYNSQLWSFFGQYNQKIGNVDLWVGARNDLHDVYKDHLSFNAGAKWAVSTQWILKILYGTAYRTPYFRQILIDEKPELEKIKSFSVQAAWKPSDNITMRISGFSSKIENHVMENPYAVLSLPNDQEIQGLEIEGRISPHKNLDLSANLTLLKNSGTEETYKNLYRIDVQLDGTIIRYYQDLNYPYDTGPDTLCNLTATWRPFENLTTFFRAGYAGSQHLEYFRSREEQFVSVQTPSFWTFDMSATFHNVFFPDLDVELSMKNITDSRDDIPGTYSIIESEPFSAAIEIRKKW